MSGTPPTVRLATVNLFSGRTSRGAPVDIAHIAAAVASLGADVVALQEVDRNQPRSGTTDQALRIARAMDARYYRFVPLVAGTPGTRGWTPVPSTPETSPSRETCPTRETSLPTGPTYGIALVSRLPVSSWHVLPLTRPDALARPGTANGRGLPWIRDEPRAVVAAVLSFAAPSVSRLVVACTHLSFVPGTALRQLLRTRRWLDGLADDAPTVLLGDLNLPGGLPARLTRWTPLARGRTFPAGAPRVQLDHALAARMPPAAARTVTSRVVTLPLSDHRAVLVDLPRPTAARAEPPDHSDFPDRRG